MRGFISLIQILSACLFVSIVQREGSLARAQAAETGQQVIFERIQLSDQFHSEGGAVGDFNQDGHVDVVVGPWIYWGPDFENSSQIYEGKEFDPVGYSKNFLMDSGDINGNGRIDIVVLGFPGEESWWFENPGPEQARQLWKRHVILDSVDNESPLMIDIDGDGLLDLVCSSGGHYGYASCAEQDPREPWKFRRISPNNNYHRFTHGLGVGDVNGDGHLDLLEKDGWWQNPGRLTDEYWSFHPFQFSPTGGAQMFAVDLDGDGRNEIVTGIAAHGFGLVYYKAVNEAATDFARFDIMTDDWTTSPVGIAVSQLHAMAIADINGDGIPDIVTGKRWWAHAHQDPGHEQPATLLWLETKRIGQRIQFEAHVIDNSSGVGTDITVADVNGDGLPDILSGTKRGAHLFLQRPSGTSAGEFLLPNWAASDPFGQQPAEQMMAVEAGFLPVFRGRPLNLNFEADSLVDWEARGPAGNNSLKAGYVDTGSSNPEWIGELISRPFVLRQPKATIKVAGSDQSETFVEMISETTGRRIAVALGGGNEQPQSVQWDLSNWLNEMVRLRVVDHSTTGHVRLDSVLFQP
jgi:hypothetical protein